MQHFKKQLTTFLSLFLIFSLFTTATYASNITSNNETYTVTVEIHQVSQTITRSITTTTGSKTYTAKTSAGSILYTYTIYGTFSHNGNTCTCINASDSYEIIDSGWKMGTHSTEKFGAQALGYATFNHFLLGTQVGSNSVEATLTCTPDGTLY